MNSGRADSRKGCPYGVRRCVLFAPSDEGAGERSETGGEKNFALSRWLSLPPSFAYGKIHLPRQREEKCAPLRVRAGLRQRGESPAPLLTSNF